MTLDDLQLPIRILLQKSCIFWSPPQKIWMNDAYYQWQKCRPMNQVSGGRSYRFPGEGASNDIGLSTTAICSVFTSYFLDTLEMNLALLYGDMQSVIGFSVIPKCMTLNGYFALNSVFVPLWLAETVRLSKNNCVKTNKDRHILPQCKSSAGSLLSGNIRFVQTFALVF